MSKENEFELSAALEQLMRYNCRGYLTLTGIITAVNEDNTCDLTVSTTEFSGVPLCVLINSQASFYPIPTIGSACLVTFRDGNINQPQILQVSEIDTLKINCITKVEFNGGTLDGMVKVNDLVDRMNNIEDKYNDLVNKYNSHTHILTLSSGTGTAAPTTTQETPTGKTTKEQLENPLITQ